MKLWRYYICCTIPIPSYPVHLLIQVLHYPKNALVQTGTNNILKENLFSILKESKYLVLIPVYLSNITYFWVLQYLYLFCHPLQIHIEKISCSLCSHKICYSGLHSGHGKCHFLTSGGAMCNFPQAKSLQRPRWLANAPHSKWYFSIQYKVMEFLSLRCMIGLLFFFSFVAFRQANLPAEEFMCFKSTWLLEEPFVYLELDLFFPL